MLNAILSRGAGFLKRASRIPRRLRRRQQETRFHRLREEPGTTPHNCMHTARAFAAPHPRVSL